LMFWTELPAYLGALFLSILLFPNLFSLLHWFWFIVLWVGFDLSFDVVYRQVYNKMHQREISRKGNVNKWFYYKVAVIQVIIIFFVFMTIYLFSPELL
ncbi:hypothetical protein MNBD_GAMMA03-621, partial [hydrothermal vent metagenome]